MKNIVIKGWMVAILAPVVIFGGIYLTIGTGHWKTVREGEPARLPTGDYSPADIRGSYAFAELEQFFGVPQNLLFDAFLIPADQRTPTFQIKNLEGMFAPVIIDGHEIEVGTDLVRVLTALYSGLPYTSTETTHIPVSAVNVLIAQNKLNAEQTAYWQAHTFELQPASAAPASATEKPTVGGIEIKGNTTMGQLRQYGLTSEQFKAITGVDMPGNPALGVRDFVNQHGLDMDTVKTKFFESLTSAQIVLPTEQTQTETSPEEPPATETVSVVTLEIKGSTTIATLLDAGLTREQFQTITGKDAPDDTTVKLKDFLEANGLEMETIRTKLTETLQP